MARTRDMSQREFDDALGKFGFVSGENAMEACVDDNGNTIFVGYIRDTKGTIRRRASLAQLWKRVEEETKGAE